MNTRWILLVSTVCSFFLVQLATAQPFVKSTVVDMGGNFGTPVIGDYDGDGDMDILQVGQERSNFLRLHLYKLTDKKFEEVLDSGLPGNATDARFVDYEKDGDLDVFVTNVHYDGTTGYFYINNNGTFTKKDNGLPMYPTAIYSAADYDNDGDADVIMYGGLPQQAKARLFRNQGDVFTEVEANLPFDAYEFAWADIDHDNDLDIYVTSSFGSGIYENDNGNFRQQRALVPNLSGGARQWADYDGDSDLDLLVSGNNGTSQTNEIKVYVNNGNKTFTATAITSATGTQQGTTMFVDYDGDGDLDIFNSGLLPTQPQFTYYAEFFTKSPSGYTKVDNPGIAAFEITQYAFLDYDGDHDLDIYVGNANGKSVVYRNNYFKDDLAPRDDQPGWPLAVVAQPETPTGVLLAFTDMEDNEDGWHIEIQRGPNAPFEQFATTGGVTSNSTVLYHAQPLNADIRYGFRIRGSNGAGYGKYSKTVYSYTASTAFTKTEVQANLQSYNSATWADVDTDGDLELIYAGRGTPQENYLGELAIYKYNGGTLVKQAHNIPNIELDDMDWADFDLDGDLDVLMSGTLRPQNVYTPTTKIFVNNGNFSFTEHSTAIRGIRSGTSRWIDINADGYLDVFVSGTEDNESNVHSNQVLISNKGVSFTESTIHNLPAVFQGEIAIADFNGDGLTDIAMTGLFDVYNRVYLVSRIQVYLNQRGGIFKLGQTLTTIAYDASLAAGDLDNDGDPDLLVASHGQPGSIYWNNNGTLKQDTGTVFPALGDPDVKLGDINKDGSLDIIIAGSSFYGGIQNAIYVNNGSGLFTESTDPLSRILSAEYAIGDTDGDNDLDLFEAGYRFGVEVMGGLFVQNNHAGVNNKPANPTITKAEQKGGEIVVEWTNGSDESSTLTSNIYVKTPDGKYLYNSISSNITGQLRTATPGNMSYTRKVSIGNLAIGQYEIGVQNIDNSYIGSGFAKTTVTTTNVAPLLLSDAVGCKNQKTRVEVGGSDVTWYKESSLATTLKSGNAYEFQMADTDVKLYVTQKFGSTQSPALEVNVKAFNPVTGKINATTDGLMAPEGTTYQWSRNDSLLIGATTRTIVASLYGKYKLKITNGPCVTDTLSYVIRPAKPTVSLLTSQLCTGDSQTITATGKNIAWYNRSGVKLGSNSSLKIDKLTTADTVVFVTQTINRGESLKQPARWKTYAYPGKQITVGDGGKIIAPQGLTYQWLGSDMSAIAGATSREFAPSGDGVFSVTVSNASCKTTSDALTYTGLEDDASLLVGYDPDRENLTIECRDTKANKIFVYDLAGKLVLSDEGQLSSTYSMRGTRPGIYVTTLYLEDNTVIKKKFLKN